MSRKARLISEVPVEENASPKIWLANKGYSEYKPDIKTGKTKDAVVILYHKAYEPDLPDGQHPLITIGGIIGRLLSQTENLEIKNIVSVDISSLVPPDKYQELMDDEGASRNLEKKLSKPVCRVLEKMFLHKATIVAFGTTCQLLLKVIPVTTTANDAGHRLTSENASRLVFINPALSTRCTNSQFRGTPSAFATMVQADIYFSSQSESDRQLPIIRSFFQKGRSCVRISQGFVDSMLSALSSVKVAGGQLDDALTSAGTILLDDLDATNNIGETVWMSEVTITMNRNSKQYEQCAADMTRDMKDLYVSCKKKNRAAAAAQQKVEPKTSNGNNKVIFALETGNQGARIGGLVLRGNRCVLVRSLQGLWEGMRIPSVKAATNETPQQTAARAVTELCDIDIDEFYILPGIEPLTIYRPYGLKEGNITVYLMYAEQPPPDGPLEDQDTEDDTDLYDWYTWHRAVKALLSTGNESSIAVMRSIACVLSAASASASAAGDFVPRKWGGVFGQEWMSLMLTDSESVTSISASIHLKGTGGTGPEMPINILIVVGAYGSGKTALIQSILSNQGTCQKIAVIVNSLSSLNLDGSVLQQSGEEDDNKNDCSTFKVIEINGCCVCCSGEKRLLAEMQKIADAGDYDYCIIDASATADLFALKKLLCSVQKSTGGGAFLLDNTAAVVDAVTCLQAATSRDSSKKGVYQPDAMESTLYRQVRAADIILINKTDLIQGEESSSSSSSSASSSSSSSSSSGGGKARAKINTIKGALRLLNSHAAFLEASYGDVDPSALLHTRRAQSGGADQLEQLNARLPDAGVSTWIFRSHRPFHPTRLDTAMREMGNLVPSDPSVINAPILRMNGYAWLANYPDNQGLLSYTKGHVYETKLGSPWWASTPKAQWPEGLEEAIRPLWREPFGDRQIEVSVIGFFNDTTKRKEVEDVLTKCLLTDDEFTLGQAAWNEMDDPFSFTWS